MVVFIPFARWHCPPAPLFSHVKSIVACMASRPVLIISMTAARCAVRWLNNLFVSGRLRPDASSSHSVYLNYVQLCF